MFSRVGVYGRVVDTESRCVHWHSRRDVLALKFRCCDRYWACVTCHEQCAGHAVRRYHVELDSGLKVVVCGVCRCEMTFAEYTGGLRCVQCHVEFNPGCKMHYSMYFDGVGSVSEGGGSSS